jgi:hypothetical protein
MPPSPLPAIGLPATWQPFQFGFRFAQIDITTPTRPQKVHVLIVDTPTGTIGLPFTPEGLRTLIDQATKLLTGLEVVRGSVTSLVGFGPH